MKILKRILFVFIIMIFVSMVNVDAAGVSIKSIRLVDHTGDATELNAPVPNGLNINFDLAFSSKDDSATYEVVLSNPTNKEYEINTEKQFSGSNYISYSYELKDKTNRIKANSEVTLYITIKYENPVPADKLVNGKYVENNNMGIVLSNESNPNTFNNILWIVFILFMLVIVSLTYKYIKKKDLFVIVLALLLVPITVFALEKLKLTVSTKITVGEKYNVYYQVEYAIKTSELNHNDYYYDEDECEEAMVKIGDSDYESYTSCSFIFKKDSKSYFEGERVSVHSINIKIENEESQECDEVSENTFSCPANSFIDKTVDTFFYQCVVNDKFNHFSPNICNLNELQAMNFESVLDSKLSGPVIGYLFKAPNKFTMQGHDVYFMYYLDSIGPVGPIEPVDPVIPLNPTGTQELAGWASA